MRIANQIFLCCGAALAASASSTVAASRQPIEYNVPARLPDVAEALSPADIQLEGWLGDRVLKNAQARLLNVDLEPLLAGYRKKPGSHPWIGEHIGKWMHAATLAWAYTGDDALRRKLDDAAAELIKAQEPDGYLGTYVPEKRFGLFQGADWDVWSHKYCLIGLLSYHQYTGDAAALEAARRAGDLLIKTFGPGRKSILSAGTHVGMAATSVLEPMVWLYRFTGDDRYLAFCRYLVEAWKEPNGPKIIDALLTARQVNKTANAKAYEMLSNLVGLCELARVTGERDLLVPVLTAWEDIVAKRLYLTGSASSHEHFQDDYKLPNDTGANVGETCVTTTWIQLNAQLLRLTGKARFGDQLERTFYNHLAAAQRPDGAQWCYYTALEGAKPYGPGINCCVSSGPRGMALVPQQAYLVKRGSGGNAADTLLVGVFEKSQVTATLGGKTVRVEQIVRMERNPDRGVITLSVATPQSARFAVGVRMPLWAQPVHFEVEGGEPPTTETRDGWLLLPAREWKDGDRVVVRIAVDIALVRGAHGNAGRAALTWGPMVLAYDQQRNSGGEPPSLLAFAATQDEPPAVLQSTENGLEFTARVRSTRQPEPHSGIFVPFAEAGREGGRYQVWLRGPEAELPRNVSLSTGAAESRSRAGNVSGSITDGDSSSFVVTFDGTKKDQDWFAVSFDQPVTLRRVLFSHGRTFHDGGWFDTSAGKPRLEVKREKNGPWESVGELESYPATTPTDARGLSEGQTFTVTLRQAEKAAALRVVGRPASGDNPRQAFSSCAELQVFAE